MAGWTGPVARALDSFDPWPAFTDEPPIATDAIEWALRNPEAAEAERIAGQQRLTTWFDGCMSASKARQAALWAADEEAEGEALVARMNLEGGRA